MTKDEQIKRLKSKLALAHKRIDILVQEVDQYRDELASERAESISKTRRASRDAAIRGMFAS